MRLPISGLGLVTSVGCGVVQSASSQRAGVLRPAECSSILVLDPEGEEVHPFVHRVRHVTDGFAQTGLWIQLAMVALADLCEYAKLPPFSDDDFWRKTELLVVTPDPLFERFGWPDELVAGIIINDFVLKLGGLLSSSMAFRDGDLFAGHCGTASAILRARTVLEEEHVDRVLVLSVDSFVDHTSFADVVEDDRLKTSERPTGLVPGEAGGCILFESEHSLASRGSRPRAYVSAVAVLSEVGPSLREQEEPSSRALDFGRAMALVASQAATDQGGSLPFRGDLILDLNGEQWRGIAWGTAEGLLADVLDLDACRRDYPCVSFGEIGATSGVAGVCLATRSFERGYSQSGTSLVVSASEGEEVSAIAITGA